MTRRPYGGAFVMLPFIVLTGCAPRATTPVPAPAPPPPSSQPAPAPPPAAAPAADWRDAPLSAGDWAYDRIDGSPMASFRYEEAMEFSLNCAAGRRIILVRPGTGGTMTIRTTFGERRLPLNGIATVLPASDPLLDQIAFSRGRFMVEGENAPPLILPAWPEAARVIEDCRA